MTRAAWPALAIGALLVAGAPASAEPTFALAWFGRDGRLLVSVSPDGRGWAPPVKHRAAITSKNGPALLYDSVAGWRLFWFTPDGTQLGMSRGDGNARRGVKFGPVRFEPIPPAYRPFDDPSVRPAVGFDGERLVIAYGSRAYGSRAYGSRAYGSRAYGSRQPGRIAVASVDVRRGKWRFGAVDAGEGWITPPALAYGNEQFLLAYVVQAPGDRYQLKLRRSPDGRRWSAPVEPTPAIHVAPVQGPVLAFDGARFVLAITNRRDREAPRFLYRYDLFASREGARWSPLDGSFVAWSTTRAAVSLAVRPHGRCALVAVSSSRPSGGFTARNIHIRFGVTRTGDCGRARTIRWAPLNAPFTRRSMLDRFVAVAYGNPD